MINQEQRLTRKCLVNLKEINIIKRKSHQVEDAWDGVGRADTHDVRGHADGGCCYEFAEDGEVKAVCGGPAGGL